MKYSTETLLVYAYKMLNLCKKEQEKSKKKRKWLVNNETFKVIENRAKELDNQS